MSNFKIIRAPEHDILTIIPTVYHDFRGHFFEGFREQDFLDAGIPKFVQENWSESNHKVFRGLHYQLNPKAQGKLVKCVSGKILDVVVDIRQNSPTFKKYFTFTLDSRDKEMIYIPPGYAHGFLTKERAVVSYKTTEYFDQSLDRVIRWDDPDLGLEWIQGQVIGKLILSDKDKKAPLLKDADNNF